MLFQDRTAAGQFLAGQLVTYANRPDVLVLALPRGGVPVAFEVAKALNASLDVLVVRKLGVPDDKELAMGALAKLPKTEFTSGGVQVLNEDIVHQLNISDEIIARVAVQEQQELERREQLYRDSRPFPDLWARTVILVDDGLATGATMRAAVMAVRQQQPARIIIAVPVAALETYQELKSKVENIVCAATPNPFYSVGRWYEIFPQTTDDEVCRLLIKAAKNYQLLFLST
ncbi:phosphoribosyltransferase [Nostocaceae cyanobacterium CENA357]|uniref:Phosphoribosyltransferase n=1 Tax=Atlanticothrix silvestris CENA357 TaxID=1725252 RepID=A0A8J7KY45_9CYAN|nr:phosphoribosyltransferase [Atlanticothrix silvestris]MBH8550811.1 phosphoribosyltransferase [Atlanticothrix silvestris CENA357]